MGGLGISLVLKFMMLTGQRLFNMKNEENGKNLGHGNKEIQEVEINLLNLTISWAIKAVSINITKVDINNLNNI